MAAARARMPRAGAVLAAALLLAAAGPGGVAQACSVGNRPAANVEKRIAGRTDLRRVQGSFRMEGVDPRASRDEPLRIHGKVVTARGTFFAVTYLYDELWEDCLVYYLPTADADGIFYLSDRSRDGEYALVDWSGTYVAGGAGIVRNDPE